jgi:hypothetical protein
VSTGFDLNSLELEFLQPLLPRERAPILGYVTKPNYERAVPSEDARAKER